MTKAVRNRKNTAGRQQSMNVKNDNYNITNAIIIIIRVYTTQLNESHLTGLSENVYKWKE